MRNFSTLLFIFFLAALSSACAPNVTTTRGEGILSESTSGSIQSLNWLLIDTKQDTLMIMQGDQLIRTFPKIAFGSSGAGIKYRSGDNKTPIGTFRVGWINDHSRFRTFIGLDYPNIEYAERALRQHKIDTLTYERIRTAWIDGYTPPQDTPLGGQIGIHGIGYGDLTIHKAGINWTSGCVALDNQQISALRPWIRVGMRVEIR